MAHDVFVSHSSKDKPVADAVCARLEAAKIRCWIAPRDILPGADWGEAIINAIEQSKLMVLVFSENANESKQITREVERAVNKGVVIVPLRIEDVKPTKALEYFISTPHWLDAITPPLETHLDYLCETARVLIDRTGDKLTAPLKPHEVPKPVPVWKRRYAQLLAAAVVVLLLFLALKPASVVDSYFYGTWESGTKGNGFYWTQTNANGTYENTVELIESGTITVTDGRLVRLFPTSDSARLISWEPTSSSTVKASSLIPNSFWAYISYSGYQNGAGIAEIGQVANNNVWTRTSSGTTSNLPLGPQAQHWESHPVLGGQEWLMTFDTTPDRKYVYKATYVDNGTLHAKDGKWTTISGTQILHSGDYQKIDRDKVTLSGPFIGSSVWKRITS